MVPHLLVGYQYTLVQQTLLFSCHHKVVGLILQRHYDLGTGICCAKTYLVIHNILQRNPKLVIEIIEKLLVEYECNPRDLFNMALWIYVSLA